MDEKKKPSLHQSQLQTLSMCGLRYQFAYVEGIRRPPSVAMAMGTATHKGVEVNLGSKMASGEMAPIGAVQEAAVDAFKVVREKDGLELSRDEKEDGEKSVIARAIDEVVRMSDLHYRELAPMIEPIHLERGFELELKGYPVNLAGTIDIQEEGRVIDLKTRARSPSEDAAYTSIQLVAYDLARKTLDGKSDGNVRLDVIVKNKTPKVVTREAVVSPDAHRALLLRVESAVKMIQSGAFYPADPDSWWCSESYCGYYNPSPGFKGCPFGARARKQVAT